MDAQRMQEVNLMGKGDRKSRKGKIWRGTNGKTRPKNKNKTKK
jgi:30S ribosomal protein S31